MKGRHLGIQGLHCRLVALGFHSFSVQPQALHAPVELPHFALFRGLDFFEQAAAFREASGGFSQRASALNGYRALVTDGGNATDEGAVLGALQEDGILRLLGGSQALGWHPAEVLAIDVTVAHAKLQLARLFPTGRLMACDFSQDGALRSPHLDQGTGPEEAQAAGGDVAHEAQDHGQAESQAGACEPDKDAAAPERFSQARHQMDS